MQNSYRQKKREKLKQIKQKRYIRILLKTGIKKEMISILQELLHKKKKKIKCKK